MRSQVVHGTDKFPMARNKDIFKTKNKSTMRNKNIKKKVQYF